MIDPVTYIGPQNRKDSAGKQQSEEELLTINLSKTIESILHNVISQKQDPVIVEALHYLYNVSKIFVPIVLFCHAIEDDSKYVRTIKTQIENSNNHLLWLSPNSHKSISKVVETILDKWEVDSLEGLDKDVTYAIFIKDYESWSHDVTNELIDTVSQLKQHEGITIGLLVDYVSNPKNFISMVPINSLMHIDIHIARLPSYKSIFSQFLWDFHKDPTLPILSPQLIIHLRDLDSEGELFRYLKYYIFEHIFNQKHNYYHVESLSNLDGTGEMIFVDRDLQSNITFTHKQYGDQILTDIKDLVGVRNAWFNDMETFKRMLDSLPQEKDSIPPSDLELFLEFMITVDDLQPTVRDFMGRWQRLKKDHWQPFLESLAKNGAIEGDVYEQMTQELSDRLAGRKKAVRRGGGNRSMDMVASANSNSEAGILRNFRTQVFESHVQFFIHNSLSPMAIVLQHKSPAAAPHFTVEKTRQNHLDPDLNNEILCQLQYPQNIMHSGSDLAALEDIWLLFELLKSHSANVNLTQCFDSFVSIRWNNTDPSEIKLAELQNRFVQAASELKFLGLATEARQSKKTKDVFMESKIFARSTHHN